jgi:hypothetical protein
MIDPTNLLRFVIAILFTSALLNSFLFDLSKANKLAADRFYEDALLAYG